MTSIEALQFFHIPHKVKEGKLTEVQLWLTPHEWIDLCTIDGEDYMGANPMLQPAHLMLLNCFQSAGWMTVQQLAYIICYMSFVYDELWYKPSFMNCMANWFEKLHQIWYLTKSS